ncbi:MAG: hypothetical protein IPP73_11600 [Chitinophagaceae bacterium]|nr:hypothetical protein [Chitinophagaceae bacterium]
MSGNSVSKDSRYSDEATLKTDTGNVVELTGKDGVPTSYIWGYSNTLPIVKAVGVSYTTLLTAYNAVSGNLATIRSQSSLSTAQVYTYTYLPLVGMITETDPRGRTIYYEYDALGRLKLIKDHDGKILKRLEYKYQQTYQN